MAGHGDVSGVFVEVVRRQHKGTINRYALGLMDRGGISVIEVAVPGGVEGENRTGVEPHGHGVIVYLTNRTERAVLDTHRPFVPEEHDPLACHKLSRPPLGLDRVLSGRYQTCG